jgi:hypothetical protein
MAKKLSSCILWSKPSHSAPSYIILTNLTRHGDPVLVPAAVDAITELLSKGGDYEHQVLMEAKIFDVTTLTLRQNPSQRQLSLKLLYDIISHLSHVIILDEGLAKQLLDLFESVLNIPVYHRSSYLYSSDPDSRLSQVLFQSLAADPRVLGSSTFPKLLPMLASADRMRNPSVSKLLRHWAQEMVPRLIEVRQVDIILKVFTYARSVVGLSAIAYDIIFQCQGTDRY